MWNRGVMKSMLGKFKHEKDPKNKVRNSFKFHSKTSQQSQHIFPRRPVITSCTRERSLSLLSLGIHNVMIMAMMIHTGEKKRGAEKRREAAAAEECDKWREGRGDKRLWVKKKNDGIISTFLSSALTGSAAAIRRPSCRRHITIHPVSMLLCHANTQEFLAYFAPSRSSKKRRERLTKETSVG